MTNDNKPAMPTVQRAVERMVTIQRAERVARALFPGDWSDGSDCLNEQGREGMPCRICGHRNRHWQDRVTEVRAAIMEAFS